MIRKGYAHWTATSYDWVEAGDYHSVITWDFKTKKAAIHRLTLYSQDLPKHTFGRNTNSFAIAVSCMEDSKGTWANPPRPEQLELMAKEFASEFKKQGVAKGDLYKYLLTHAEAAALRDYPKALVARFSNKRPSIDWDKAAEAAGLPHANYGVPTWPDGWPGGDMVRWDLFQLSEKGKPGEGGHLIREMVASYM